MMRELYSVNRTGVSNHGHHVRGGILAFCLLLLTPSVAIPQACQGNPNVGCTHSGAACSPVTSGTGAGHCKTPGGLPKGELSCECVGTLPPPVDPNAQRITHTVSADAKTETWQIYNPIVNQQVTEYTTIRFQPNDSIKVNATGCVQTGGKGLTWKRYVNPSGDNSDRLYYGLIWIPGVVGAPWPALKRFKDVNGSTLGAPANLPTAQLYLRLGYIDDDYHDNGYANPDKGTENQCVGQGNAQVSIVVTHGAGTGITNPTDPTPLPFDLLSNTYDDNLIPLNPYWGYQKLHQGVPPSAEKLCAVTTSQFGQPVTSYYPDQAPCTRQPTSRDDTWYCGPHANWGPATETGSIVWESHSTGHTGDDDYSWYLAPVNGNGLTATRTALEPEFKASETIDYFATTWWNNFHLAVDEGGTAANVMVDNKYSIVSGLFSLDFEHTIHSEIHPVFAMAVRVKDDDPNDETWVWFVRRFGNEGFCGSHIHYLDYLPSNQFIFRLPLIWGTNATLASNDLTWNARIGSPATPDVSFVPGAGVLVTVTMSEDPAARQLIHGEIHLHWTNGIATATSKVPVTRNEGEEGSEIGTEAYYKRLVGGMTPAQLTQLSQLVPAAPQPVDRKAIKVVAIHRTNSPSTLPVRPQGTPHPAVRSVVDPDQVQNEKVLVEAIHKVTNTPLPPPRPPATRPAAPR